MPDIKDSWKRYQEDHNEVKLFEKVTNFLEQMYRYDSSFLSTIVYFIDKPEDVYFTYRSNYYGSIKEFENEARDIVAQVAEEIDTGIGCATQKDHLYMIPEYHDCPPMSRMRLLLWMLTKTAYSRASRGFPGLWITM